MQLAMSYGEQKLQSNTREACSSRKQQTWSRQQIMATRDSYDPDMTLIGLAFSRASSICATDLVRLFIVS